MNATRDVDFMSTHGATLLCSQHFLKSILLFATHISVVYSGHINHMLFRVNMSAQLSAVHNQPVLQGMQQLRVA